MLRVALAFGSFAHTQCARRAPSHTERAFADSARRRGSREAAAAQAGLRLFLACDLQEALDLALAALAEPGLE